MATKEIYGDSSHQILGGGAELRKHQSVLPENYTISLNQFGERGGGRGACDGEGEADR